MALLIYMQYRAALLTRRLPAYLPVQIKITCIEVSLIYVVIEGPHGNRHAISISVIDNRNRDSVSDQRNDVIRKEAEFIFRKRDAGS